MWCQTPPRGCGTAVREILPGDKGALCFGERVASGPHKITTITMVKKGQFCLLTRMNEL
jgi:hypothetical protein